MPPMQIGVFIQLLIQAISLVVIVDVLASWVSPNPNGFPRSITSVIADPLRAPFQAVLRPEKLGGIDISPLLVLLSLGALADLAARLTLGL